MLRQSGEILDAIIKSEGIAYKDFAKLIGVSPNIIRFAIHRNVISDTLVQALNKHYGVDFSYLQKEDWRGIKFKKGNYDAD